MSWISDTFHALITELRNVSSNVIHAFIPLLKTEAASFVAKYRVQAIEIVKAAAARSDLDGKGKALFFAEEMGRTLLADGVSVAPHLLNLLREIVVAELRATNVIP